MLGEQIHRTGTFVLSLLMALLGLALMIETVAISASVISARMLLGVLLAAAGLLRIYVEIRRRRA